MAIRCIPLGVALSLASVALSDSCAVAQTPAVKAADRSAAASRDRLSVHVAVRAKPATSDVPQAVASPAVFQQSVSTTQATQSPATESDPNRGSLAPLAMEGVQTPIRAVNILPSDIGTRILPEDEAAKLAHPIVPLPGGAERGWGYLDYRWQATNLYHWPLYFEDPMLERHGQYRTPECIQPAVSGAKFLGNVALYPYRAALWPAFESRYTLGHFRPGSSAPLVRDTMPWSTRAALYQGAAATGVFVGLPW